MRGEERPVVGVVLERPMWLPCMSTDESKKRRRFAKASSSAQVPTNSSYKMVVVTLSFVFSWKKLILRCICADLGEILQDIVRPPEYTAILIIS